MPPPPPQVNSNKGRTCHVVVSDQEVGTGTTVDQGEEFRGGRETRKKKMKSSKGNKSRDFRRVTLKLAANIESLVKNKPGKFGGHSLKDDRDTVVKQRHRGRHGKPGGLEIPPVLTAEAQIGKVAVADEKRTAENTSEGGEKSRGTFFVD